YSRLDGNLFNKVFHQVGNMNVFDRLSDKIGFLSSDPPSDFDRLGIVGDDLAFDTVLQWSYDTSPVGVILGICGEDKLDVQRQPEFEAPNLDVSFLQDVEQRHLNPRLQIRKFVDHEDA